MMGVLRRGDRCGRAHCLSGRLGARPALPLQLHIDMIVGVTYEAEKSIEVRSCQDAASLEIDGCEGNDEVADLSAQHGSHVASSTPADQAFHYGVRLFVPLVRGTVASKACVYAAVSPCQ